MELCLPQLLSREEAISDYMRSLWTITSGE
jgi:hypothetical protein